MSSTVQAPVLTADEALEDYMRAVVAAEQSLATASAQHANLHGASYSNEIAIAQVGATLAVANAKLAGAAATALQVVISQSVARDARFAPR